MIIIFTYKRYERLKSLIESLPGERIVVIDDGSDYDPSGLKCEYCRYTHQGKEGFWQLWNEALKLATDEWVLFLQDDVTDVQLDEIKRITKDLDYYAFNIMNRGPDRGWTTVPTGEVEIAGVECEKVRYADCIFATNKKTLDKIGRYMDPISPTRFIINPRISSGVGQQLSQRFAKLNIPMYMPKKSLAYHGDHESIMHPLERKLNPLVSI